MFKPSLEVLEDRTMPSGFGILPPEINSAFMYAGAGSGPMLAAASAWNGLAADLQAAATSYGAVISGLSGGGWSGPALATTANREQLASLIATNVLGQNTPAIAETEAHYMEMWVQDAASFAGYIDRHA